MVNDSNIMKGVSKRKRCEQPLPPLKIYSSSSSVMTSVFSENLDGSDLESYCASKAKISVECSSQEQSSNDGFNEGDLKLHFSEDDQLKALLR